MHFGGEGSAAETPRVVRLAAADCVLQRDRPAWGSRGDTRPGSAGGMRPAGKPLRVAPQSPSPPQGEPGWSQGEESSPSLNLPPSETSHCPGRADDRGRSGKGSPGPLTLQQCKTNTSLGLSDPLSLRFLVCTKGMSINHERRGEERTTLDEVVPVEASGPGLVWAPTDRDGV